MISFLDLKGLNAQYKAELIEACTRVISKITKEKYKKYL